VLLVVISLLLPLIGPLPFFGLELFVGFVQALVFTMLTLVFLQIATSHHAERDDHRAQRGHHASPDVTSDSDPAQRDSEVLLPHLNT